MAVINLSRLRSEATARVRNATITSAQWNIWANEAQDEIVSLVDMAHLNYETTFSTVASTRLYYLDQFLPGAISSVRDRSNDLPLVHRDEKEVEAIDVDWDDAGSPMYYSLAGLSQIEGQPSAASAIRIVSASGSDTTQRVRIRGVVSGQQNYELLSLNGTSNVDGTLSFSEVVSITKDAVTSGAITVTDVSGGTTLAVLPRAKFGVEYQKLALWPVPNAVITIAVRGLRRPLDFVNDEDIPDVPESFHEIIVVGMQRRAHEHLYDIQRSNELLVVFQNKIKQLSGVQDNKFEQVRRLRTRADLRGFSTGRLPPDFS